MLARLLIERLLCLEHVAARRPRVRRRSGHLGVAKVAGGSTAVRCGPLELVRRRVVQLGGGLEALVHATSLSRDKGSREVMCVERAQVVESLADTDELDRQPELVGDRDGDPAFR